MTNKISKILITGGTGFIGKELCLEFIKENYKITVLTRNKTFKNNSHISYINNLDDVDFDFNIVINLAGAPISVYWNKINQQEIYDSRINITKAIVKKINNSQNPPLVFISGSAIGIYGNQFNQICDADSFNGNANSENIHHKIESFSSQLCLDWEKTALEVQNKTRVILLRTGIVLGKKKQNLEGFLKKIYLPFSLGLGAKIGDGKQIMSWIAIEDVIGAIKLIIDNSEIKNAINLASPQSITNENFSNIFANCLNRPCLFSFPNFMIKILYGKMGEELMLNSQNIFPSKLLSYGYKFKFPEIDKCLNNIFKN